MNLGITDSLSKHLPAEQPTSIEFEISGQRVTRGKVIKLTDHELRLILYGPAKRKDQLQEIWRSNVLGSAQELDGIWQMCWTDPPGLIR